MPSARVSRAFKDISFSFDPHPVTKDLPVLINERAIIRSIRNLVETIPTERFFDSLLGSDVRDSLFENYSRGQVSIIEDQIRETCKRYEPRVDDVGVTVDANPDDNTLNVKVFFNIVGLESAPQSFTFILEPTR